MSWRESNPMLGTRGVRLGVVKPGLYAMQVRALMEAACERVAAGGHPIVEIMIPLTVTREEMALARSWVERHGRRPRTPAPQGRRRRGGQAAARGHHRHDDRDSTGCVCWPTRSPRWPTSSPSGPTT